jgi:transposase
MDTPIEGKYSTEKVIYVALELSQSTWKIGIGTKLGEKVRIRTIETGDRESVKHEIAAARKRYRVGESAQIKSCYEAGLDGFWVHWWLTGEGVENIVVDPSSMKVERRARRAKTDRLDVQELLRYLIQYDRGDRGVWKAVHIPSEEEEDQRHLHRQYKSFQRDLGRHRNRIYGLLKTQGVSLRISGNFSEKLSQVRKWDGEPLRPGLQGRIKREYAQWQKVRAQLLEMAKERKELIATGQSAALQQVGQLMQLKGIGENGAWLLVMEFFGWRKFQNQRQVGAAAGLVSSPYASGSSYRDQGITKAGNGWVRAMMIQLAWLWLRYQPHSTLSKWWMERYGHASRRERRKGIVALARKLLIGLWRYLEKGEIPEGAELKPKA